MHVSKKKSYVVKLPLPAEAIGCETVHFLLLLCLIILNCLKS